MFNWLFGLKCPDCGKRFRENEQYCPNCGANLDASHEQLSKEIAQQYLGKAKKAYDRGSRLKVALTNCDLAIQYDPDSARAHNLRGLILDAMGRTAEAILCYREAIRIDPLFEEAGENLKDAETERLNRPSEEKRASPSDGKWFTVILGMVGIITCIIVVGAALGGLYLLYRFGREYLGPKTTLTFEPDTSRISQVDPSDLEKTAELLTERCQLLGYTQVSFVVTQDNKITGKVPGSIDAEALQVALMQSACWNLSTLAKRVSLKEQR